ncbi:uncharacterized protein PGTG_21011 [Puccinia graminis f. sp. tritici CRL 75-36-700-3]|uniref:Uncharacterized protein n=1 Tax=Puccinia graminis f. sp. tritici (strain CRL 75-36-700-3 / race SCCL) TaxID=418459 RepID=H6QQ32_PUCGT|nr:uncharacterized protein PGTG_21011 [Puccinia graminis f. sp. tritici CRL 75-36-700-3]EHS64660.1 hypothetical protein PGTG_21011 [Puccinia graminis f. sp. tritici CRL 75-36-700-3]
MFETSRSRSRKEIAQALAKHSYCTNSKYSRVRPPPLVSTSPATPFHNCLPMKKLLYYVLIIWPEAQAGFMRPGQSPTRSLDAAQAESNYWTDQRLREASNLPPTDLSLSLAGWQHASGSNARRLDPKPNGELREINFIGAGTDKRYIARFFWEEQLRRR